MTITNAQLAAIAAAGLGALALFSFRGRGSQEQIEAFARAIAKAEGFLVNGSVAQRAKNPGNLKLGDRGQGAIDGKTIFATLSDGWSALLRQVQIMADADPNNSLYKPHFTLLETAVKYTGNDNAAAWASIVAHEIGADVNDTLREIFS